MKHHRGVLSTRFVYLDSKPRIQFETIAKKIIIESEEAVVAILLDSGGRELDVQEEVILSRAAFESSNMLTLLPLAQRSNLNPRQRCHY